MEGGKGHQSRLESLPRVHSARWPLKREGARPLVSRATRMYGPLESSAIGQPAAASIARRACLSSDSRIQARFCCCSSADSESSFASRSFAVSSLADFSEALIWRLALGTHSDTKKLPVSVRR